MSTKVLRRPWGDNNSEKDNDGLHVIGAGLPRTGTLSLKAALEILGFGPCHHMYDLVEKTDRIVEFTRAYDGEKMDFRKLMQGYRSTVDSPTTDFYKELHQVYPQARIILTVRDSNEKWFESFQNTIGCIVSSNFYDFAIYFLRYLRSHNILVAKMLKKWNKQYGSIGPLTHDQHNKQVINENKADEILVYNIKNGWPPLCKFFDVDIPRNIPFPNINDTKAFNRRIMLVQIVGFFLWAVVGALFILFIYFIMRIVFK